MSDPLNGLQNQPKRFDPKPSHLSILQEKAFLAFKKTALLGILREYHILGIPCSHLPILYGGYCGLSAEESQCGLDYATMCSKYALFSPSATCCHRLLTLGLARI